MIAPEKLGPTTLGREILFKETVLLAVWFGLVTGLVEGAGLLLFQKLRWLSWRMLLQSVSVEIIWISALFDLCFFAGVGLLLVGVGKLFPRVLVLRLSVLLFTLLTFLDWLMLPGRLRHSGALAVAMGLAVVCTRWTGAHEAAALRFRRRTLPSLVGLATLALVGIQGGLWLKERIALARLPAVRPGTPNVLVIVVDTLRADHLSAYDYGRPTTPNIDRFAQQGVLFENAFSTSSWTLPAHTSLLTGLFPHEHRATVSWTQPSRAEFAHLDGRYPTLPERLRDRGFRTGAFSANTIWFSPRHGFARGFIRFEAYFHSVSDMIARTVLGRQFEEFVLHPLGYEDRLGRKRAEDVNREVLRWIDLDPSRPFFAFLNYFDTHDPYLPPEPYRHRFSTQNKPGGRINWLMWRRAPQLTPEQLQGEMDAYDGALTYVDHSIGELLTELDKRGLAETTLVVFTSDHGEGFGDHGMFLHGNSLYRELIQVPLAFRWPGHLPAGLRVEPPISLASIPATVMELIGAGDHTVFPGPLLAALWRNPGLPSGWPLPLAELTRYHTQPGGNRRPGHGAMKSLASSRWHFIVDDLGVELYDPQADPRELNNLASTPKGQQVGSAFARELQTLLARAQKASLSLPRDRAIAGQAQ